MIVLDIAYNRTLQLLSLCLLIKKYSSPQPLSFAIISFEIYIDLYSVSAQSSIQALQSRSLSSDSLPWFREAAQPKRLVGL